MGLPISVDGMPELIGIPPDVKGRQSFEGERHFVTLDMHQGQRQTVPVVFHTVLTKKTAHQILSAGQLPEWIGRLQVMSEFRLDLIASPNCVLANYLGDRIHRVEPVFGGRPTAKYLCKWISKSRNAMTK